jgi:anti-sigma regulatory factor (Ser/Thr protein kinase)
MPALSRTAMFLARLDQLRAMRAFLEDFCVAAQIGEHHCLRMNLVLEELFTNTVRHGHRGDSDSPVWITLLADQGKLHLTYEDAAPPFNPYGTPPGAPPDTTVKMRKIGGLGVILTRQLALSRDYAYLYGRNRIRLAMALA